jgi:hypothetical protein
MKKTLICLIGTLLFAGTLVLDCLAENFPEVNSDAKNVERQSMSSVQKKIFYGYVPPAPILHTWPGGYKVIFHELTNTLMDHLTGHF